MTKKKLIIWIPVAALLVNGLIYFIVSNVRTPDAPVAGGAAPRPSPALSQEHREAPKVKDAKTRDSIAGSAATPSAPSSAPSDEQKDRDDEKTALARRAIGLAALEAGDYEKALINFTEARALLGDKAQVADLLRVTEELRGRPGSASAHHGKPSAPVHVVPPPHPAARPSLEHRVAVKENPAPAEPPSPAAAEAPPSGLLIVTTTPRGLLVQVDETPVDLSPMRTKVKPGLHRVALLDGDRKVYESTFAVKEGATATVFKDVSSEIAAESKAASLSSPPSASSSSSSPSLSPSSSSAPAPTPPALAKEDPPRAPAIPAAALAAEAPRTTDGIDLRGSGTGALAITSPGLYGVVWVNGRPRGYPPVEVGDMPAGPTKVEVRVNGVEKRSSTVVVHPGVTTAVRLRSAEASP